MENQGLQKKLIDKNWKPDYGLKFNKKSGASAIGVRDFLIAYNINLNKFGMGEDQLFFSQLSKLGKNIFWSKNI